MSRKMAGLVGFVIGQEFVDPPIMEICVTTDGFVLARVGEQAGCDTFVGAYADVSQNWNRLLAAANLTTEEQIEATCRFAERIGFFGKATA
jgi:hypothetical protein